MIFINGGCNQWCVEAHLCDIVAEMSHDIFQLQCGTWISHFKIKTKKPCERE
jgi:hypothetical protein